jgi:hypothetical protein
MNSDNFTDGKERLNAADLHIGSQFSSGELKLLAAENKSEL